MKDEKPRKLWAPWRIEYILGPKDDGCVFCEKGDAEPAMDRKNLVLARGKHVFVLMNTYPYNPGHLLVAPYKHVANPEDLSREARHELFELVVTWKQRLETVMNAQGVNIGINLGSVAGAGIVEHLHAHIVPRWQGDTNFMTTVSDTRVVSQALDELYAELTEQKGDKE